MDTHNSMGRLAIYGGNNAASDTEMEKLQVRQLVLLAEEEASPATKMVIDKLLKDYEDMEKRYQQEKHQHSTTVGKMQKQLQQIQAGVIEVALCQPENGTEINIPYKQDTSDLEEAMDNTTNLHDSQYLDDSNDNNNDDNMDKEVDLSSKVIERLLDEDATSDCEAAAAHLGNSRQYWRDIILGVNDGLVSTFLLVAGVAGGGLSTLNILLTAIAGAVAGAVSMCAGEYLATKSQNEVIMGEIKLERNHISHHRRDELLEVTGLLELIGITRKDRELQKRLLKHYASDSEALLKIMVALELGFLEDEVRSPIMAGLVSFCLFLVGAVPSVIPFMIPDIDPTIGLITSAVATSTMLLIVGAVKTWATKGNCLTAALENLCIAGFGGSIAYGTGVLTEMVLNK